MPRMSEGRNAQEVQDRVRETSGINPRRETSIFMFHIQKKEPTPLFITLGVVHKTSL